MIIGKPLNLNLLKSKYDCIIIGSGISGLTCAGVLSELGKSVLVLEQHYTLGGMTHTYKRKGYEWGAGVHYIGDMEKTDHPFRLTFDFLSNGNLKWSHITQEYDRFIFEDLQINLNPGEKAFLEELTGKLGEKYRNKIKNYLKTIEQCTKFGEDFYKAKVLPSWVDIVSFNYFTKHAKKLASKTTFQALRDLGFDDRAIGILTAQYGNYGLGPKKSSFFVHAIVARHYLDGASYPIGGSSQIAKSIVEQIEAKGGELYTRAEVSQIICQNEKAIGVELRHGHKIYSENIISTVGVHNTVNKLVKEYPEKRKINQLKASAGLFLINLGLNQSSEKLNLSPANFWIHHSYDHDKSIDDYFSRITKTPPFTYCSFASAKDPAWESRFPEKSSIDIIGIAPYKWFSEMALGNSKDAYASLKFDLAKPYLENLYRLLPHIKPHVEVLEIGTPLTNKRYCAYEQGEIYGLEPSPNRIIDPLTRPKSKVKNLYFSGQDVVFAGVCGALNAGLITVLSMYPLKTKKLLEKLKILK